MFDSSPVPWRPYSSINVRLFDARFDPITRFFSMALLSLYIWSTLAETDNIPITCAPSMDRVCSTQIEWKEPSRDCDFLRIRYQHRQTHSSSTNLSVRPSSSITTNVATTDDVGVRHLESCSTSISSLFTESWFNIDCNEIEDGETAHQYARPCTQWHVIDLLDPITAQIDQQLHPTNQSLTCTDTEDVVGYLETECVHSIEQTISINSQCTHFMVTPNAIEEITVRFMVADVARLSGFNLSILCHPSAAGHFEVYSVSDQYSLSHWTPFLMMCSEKDHVFYVDFEGRQLSLSPNREYEIKIEFEFPFTTSLCTESWDHPDSAMTVMPSMDIQILDIYYNQNHRVEPQLNIAFIRPNHTLIVSSDDDANRNSSGLYSFC